MKMINRLSRDRISCLSSVIQIAEKESGLHDDPVNVKVGGDAWKGKGWVMSGMGWWWLDTEESWVSVCRCVWVCSRSRCPNDASLTQQPEAATDQTVYRKEVSNGEAQSAHSLTAGERRKAVLVLNARDRTSCKTRDDDLSKSAVMVTNAGRQTEEIASRRGEKDSSSLPGLTH